jgi:hypothetical protein
MRTVVAFEGIFNLLSVFLRNLRGSPEGSGRVVVKKPRRHRVHNGTRRFFPDEDVKIVVFGSELTARSSKLVYSSSFAACSISVQAFLSPPFDETPQLSPAC